MQRIIELRAGYRTISSGTGYETERMSWEDSHEVLDEMTGRLTDGEPAMIAGAIEGGWTELRIVHVYPDGLEDACSWVALDFCRRLARYADITAVEDGALADAFDEHAEAEHQAAHGPGRT